MPKLVTTAFNLMDMNVGQITRHMSDLINQQRFVEALEDGRKWLDIKRAKPKDAHFWFQMYLAAGLTGSPSANLYRQRAEECPNFTAEMHGDMLRDEVNAVIKHYRHGHEPEGFSRSEMFAMLDVAYTLHQTNPEKRIADLIMQAKLHYYFGGIGKADGVCDRAATLSKALRHPNPQFDRNLRFIRMRVKVSLNELTLARQLAREILADDGEQAEARKKAARLVLWLPFFAAGFLDWRENRIRR